MHFWGEWEGAVVFQSQLLEKIESSIIDLEEASLILAM